MNEQRRDFLKLAACGLANLAAPALLGGDALAQIVAVPGIGSGAVFDIRRYGAVGDGKTIDSAAIDRAIAAAAARGGTVLVPAGTYACYSIHLKSAVTLYLDRGARIVAADTPAGGAGAGYDAAESNAPWEAYQDFGHNHWHNSLIWGEDLHDVAIAGPGLVWGRGLSRGFDDPDLPPAQAPGVGNKAIALKNCRNVTLRDFSVLAGGHFAVLATGVDNLAIDNLRIDTNRDGIDIDCCRDVRIVNCRVNSPWDDAICPKSSYALGYARATENVTIANCYVTGNYRMGTLLDGTREPFPPEWPGKGWQRTGRIKCGTESNGGFRNITIRNCIFEGCRGIALETVDGGVLEDVTIDGITMRDMRNAPIFLRLGARMRGPAGIPVGSLRHVRVSNVVCHGPENQMPSIVCGIPGHEVEDVRISDSYFLHKGGGGSAMAALHPAETINGYPEPSQLGPLPAQHFFLRHARGLEFRNVELASVAPDARPSFWLDDVGNVDLSHVKLPAEQHPAVMLNAVYDFRLSGTPGMRDTAIAGPVAHEAI